MACTRAEVSLTLLRSPSAMLMDDNGRIVFSSYNKEGSCAHRNLIDSNPLRMMFAHAEEEIQYE